MIATAHSYLLNFKTPGGTSRGILHQKQTYFLKLKDEVSIGVGECGLFRGLSYDDRSDYEEKLQWLCANINKDCTFLYERLKSYPSILFGLEQALLSLESEDPFLLSESAFTKGQDSIPINGLIWMGPKSSMLTQIKEKLSSGFTTIKLKIGAIDFEDELQLLHYIRSEFDADAIEIRVDANGAFDSATALEKLKRLAEFQLHSIEQPISAGQIHEMASLCEKTPLPIALDEELIGVVDRDKKRSLLETIQPQYVIFKPSLCGGYQGTDEWIEFCEQQNIGWWITSALESNIGLNAIAQYTYSKKVQVPQGLGTGGLFTNNLDSPLFVEKGTLNYGPQRKWGAIENLIP